MFLFLSPSYEGKNSPFCYAEATQLKERRTIHRFSSKGLWAKNADFFLDEEIAEILFGFRKERKKKEQDFFLKDQPAHAEIFLLWGLFLSDEGSTRERERERNICRLKVDREIDRLKIDR